MSRRISIFVGVVASLLAGPARAGDFFVVTDTFKSQEEAQERAAKVGGWALDTDAYPGLAPGLFAVVRGPFASKEAAERELKEFPAARPRSAYVKDAGALRLPAALTRSVPPALLAALLGELSIKVKDRPGGENPCEPDEPYQELLVSIVTEEHTYDQKTGKDGTKPSRVTLDLGSFSLIKRTGEVQRMRICLE
jgi:hypothetical protein